MCGARCASKIGQGDLLRIIERLPKVEDPNVLIGAAAGGMTRACIGSAMCPGPMPRADG
jgi:hypothetical protein